MWPEKFSVKDFYIPLEAVSIMELTITKIAIPKPMMIPIIKGFFLFLKEGETPHSHTHSIRGSD